MTLLQKIRPWAAEKVQAYRLAKLRLKGYDIGQGCIIESGINWDLVNPQGVHVGKECLIAHGVTILTHDHCKRVGPKVIDCWRTDTVIGDRCFIAVNAMIMAGVHIGNECVVGAGAVVTKDVPSNCIVAGNPARIIRKGIKMTKRAEIINWNPNEGFVGTERV